MTPPQLLHLPNAEVAFWPTFAPVVQADVWLRDILALDGWHEAEVLMFGKRVKVPRLTAWYGDPGRVYTYSHLRLTPLPWPPPLLSLRAVIEPLVGVTFNSVLLNQYRTGRDSMGWHSDDERELGPAPVIASVSLGGTRRFQFRPKVERQPITTLELTHGSLLVMRGTTQTHWQHQVPKQTGPVAPRVNLTFRVIQD